MPYLTVEKLNQYYVHTTDDRRYQRYDYTAPVFDFACSSGVAVEAAAAGPVRLQTQYQPG